MTLSEFTEKAINNGIVTHNGTFHADDVFSTALIQLLVGADLVPTRIDISEISKYQNCIIYDIGGGEFDHHKEHGDTYEDGVRKASLGLLWDAFGEEKYGTEVYSKISIFVKELDECDTEGYARQGLVSSSISRIISAFNPVWDETNVDPDKNFMEAVYVAKQILVRKILNEEALKRAKAMFHKTVTRDGIKTFDTPGQWTMFYEKGCICVISPSNRGDGYIVRPSNKAYNLPTTWITRPPEGCVYVHPQRRLARFTSYQDALNATTEYVKLVMSIINI